MSETNQVSGIRVELGDGRYRIGFAIFGECEVCDTPHTDEKPLQITLHYGNMYFCKECWEKESAATEQLKRDGETIDIVESIPSSPINVIKLSRDIDNSIEIKSDLFNSSTIAILDLKQSIQSNPSIDNKPYALATELIARFNHHKSVIFDANEVIVKATNDQRAIQVYLNQMSNTLRAEEREKLKIADINYKPNVVRPIKPATIKTTGTRKSTKLDKVELRKYASELGIPEFTLQMLVVSKGITVEAAANMLRKSIAQAKADSTNQTNSTDGVK